MNLKTITNTPTSDYINVYICQYIRRASELTDYTVMYRDTEDGKMLGVWGGGGKKKKKVGGGCGGGCGGNKRIWSRHK